MDEAEALGRADVVEKITFFVELSREHLLRLDYWTDKAEIQKDDKKDGVWISEWLANDCLLFSSVL